MISDEDHEAYKALCTTRDIVEEEGESLDKGVKSLASVLEAALKIQVSAYDMMAFIDKVSRLPCSVWRLKWLIST